MHAGDSLPHGGNVDGSVRRLAGLFRCWRGASALEQRLGLLIAHAKVLRATNDNLRRDLAAAEARNQVLSERVAEAKRRLDALVSRLPESTQ